MPRAINPSGIRRNHTTIVDTPEKVTIPLYSTGIFVWDRAAKTVTLDTGGHGTRTTFRRMNECLYWYALRQENRPFLRVCKDSFAKASKIVYHDVTSA